MVVLSLIILPLASADNSSSEQKLIVEIKAPAVFQKPMPDTPNDLKEMQAHVKLVAARVMPAVVNAKAKAQGSGVIISEDGLVLTAGHVSGAPGTAFILTFPDGKQVKGKALGQNKGTDTGLIQITEVGKYPYCEMGNSGDLKKNDWCIAIGHPGGLKPGRTPPVRLGRINGVPGKAEPDLVKWVATDATLVGGDSGGPLFDINGKVIGIHSRISNPLTSNMHVPVDTFKLEWTRLMKGETWGGAKGGGGKGKGQPQPKGAAFGGVIFAPDAKKLEIAAIEVGSSADKAGLKPGDLITAVNGKAVATVEEYRAEIGKGPAGSEVTIEVRRGTETLKLKGTMDKEAK